MTKGQQQTCRTNIEMTKVNRANALKATGLTTPRIDAVELGLRTLIKLKKQENTKASRQA